MANPSVLDAPRNNEDSTDNYVCQLCVSWPHREGFLDEPTPSEIPASDAEKVQFIQKIAASWAEPFRTLAGKISEKDTIMGLQPHDFPPPRGMHSDGRVILMGDSLHAMAMCKSASTFVGLSNCL